MSITFKQFQSTKTWYNDLSKTALSDASLEDVSGYLYVNSLYMDASAPSGPYHLQIGRDEWLSDSLEELERKLYEYGCDEGHCDIADFAKGA